MLVACVLAQVKQTTGECQRLTGPRQRRSLAAAAGEEQECSIKGEATRSARGPRALSLRTGNDRPLWEREGDPQSRRTRRQAASRPGVRGLRSPHQDSALSRGGPILRHDKGTCRCQDRNRVRPTALRPCPMQGKSRHPSWHNRPPHIPPRWPPPAPGTGTDRPTRWPPGGKL